MSDYSVFSVSSQLEQAISQGLIVDDWERGLAFVQRIGNKRFKAYSFPFLELENNVSVQSGFGSKHDGKRKKVKEIFICGTTISDIEVIYGYDMRLRNLSLYALSDIEIALRVDVAHKLGELDDFAHRRKEFFVDDNLRLKNNNSVVFKFESWLKEHDKAFDRNKKKESTTTAEQVPIWESCDFWSFGMLSRLFLGMRKEEQVAISSRYGVGHGKTFASWVVCLNYLRNVCAHHGRLWNKNMVFQPSLAKAKELTWVIPYLNDEHAHARCFLHLMIIRQLLKVIDPCSSWPNEMKNHLLNFPDFKHLSLERMGAPPDWEKDW